MLLIFGIALWSVVHLYPAIASDHRSKLMGAIGTAPYKGLFALLILASLACIIMGFRSMPIEMLYVAPAGMRHLTMLLMPIAVVLFVAARIPSDIKRVIRHPQLIAVKLWALAHLLANGESRSVILFAGLLTWAVLEVIFINRRDGEWVKPAAKGALSTAIVIVVGLAATVGIVFGHQYLAGVALISR